MHPSMGQRKNPQPQNLFRLGSIGIATLGTFSVPTYPFLETC